MDTNAIMMMLQDKLPKDAMSLASLKDRLDKLNAAQREKFSQALSLIKLKSSTIGLVLGLLFGGLGVDRFYKGNIGLGVLKTTLFVLSYILFMASFVGLLAISLDESGSGVAEAGSIGMIAVSGILLFAFAVWVIADWFLVYKGIKKDNLAKVMTALSGI